MIFELQKASILKRIAAFILDFILLCIVAVGFAFLISAITDFDGHIEAYQSKLTYYEELHGVKLDDVSDSMSEEELAPYREAYDELIADDEAMRAYSLTLNLTLLITSLGILFGYLVTEFTVPLILKNGQTVGKKVFGLAVMRVDGIRMTPFMLFARTLLGKCTVETMIPVLIIIMIFFNSIGIIGYVVLAALLILEIVLIIATKTNSAIHDALSQTVVVDMASQMIFDTEADLIEYKKKVAAQKAENNTY